MRVLPVLLLAATMLPGADEPPAPGSLEETSLLQLRLVRRIYVDRLTGGETAAQMRDILIGSLAATRLFVVTENQEHADAVMRGAAEDLVFTEVHTSSDNINAHVNVGQGRTSGSTRGSYGGVSLGESESDHSAERRHEAIAAVRLVNMDGDVIWSSTTESRGAKFQGASADVADRIAARLREDIERARKLK
jgi:hypothetical protein